MPNSAASAYAARHAEIKAQIAQLQAALKSHARLEKAHPGNWGFAGDLGHVSSQLADLVTFVKGE